MTKGGKLFLAWVFLAAAVGFVVAYFVMSHNYEEDLRVWESNDLYAQILNGEGNSNPPPTKPNPAVYFGGAAVLAVGSFVMFNMALADRSTHGALQAPPDSDGATGPPDDLRGPENATATPPPAHAAQPPASSGAPPAWVLGVVIVALILTVIAGVIMASDDESDSPSADPSPTSSDPPLWYVGIVREVTGDWKPRNRLFWCAQRDLQSTSWDDYMTRLTRTTNNNEPPTPITVEQIEAAWDQVLTTECA